MTITAVFNKLFNLDEGCLFYRFNNADGKIWIMPAKNLRTAMELYQPSGWKGKWMKRGFPMLHKIRMVRSLIHTEKIRCRFDGKLKKLLEKVTDTEELDFSIFCGTPCVHQKITIQLSKGHRILGYCKATDSCEIAALFENEAQLLNVLHKKGIRSVPECLFCGDLGNGVSIFVQSTTKTSQSKVVHEWGILHDKFLLRLKEATIQEIAFEKSDFCRVLTALQKHTDWLPEEVDKAMVMNVVEDTVKQWEGKHVGFCAYHADFTPWNMYVEQDELFVFDWEYAQMTYPPLLDKYHFFIQTFIFERHWTAQDIMAYVDSPDGKWMDKKLFKCYLLDMIARFTIREKGTINGDISRLMQIWCGLLAGLTM